MNYQPVPPARHYAPQYVGPGTWLVRQVQESKAAPLSVYINSLIITGTEPVIVDTGSAANRNQWLEDAFSIVDPTDVRWVFLSHDDADHTGNLAEVMTRCRNAILVCNWALVERFSNAFDFPLERCRWVDHGERFDVGDRALRAFRPPLYDSPATRGLLDERTGVYWAVDAFATPMPETVATIGDLDPEFWAQSNAMFVHHGLSPWVTLVDPDRYRKSVDQLQALSAKVITGAHNPVITAADIPVALGIMRGLPTADVPPPPDQAVLDVIVGHAAA
jgi:flavorubredoxin